MYNLRSKVNPSTLVTCSWITKKLKLELGILRTYVAILIFPLVDTSVTIPLLIGRRVCQSRVIQRLGLTPFWTFLRRTSAS